MELWKGPCFLCAQRKGREIINLWPSTRSSLFLSHLALFQLEEVRGKAQVLRGWHHKIFPSDIPAADWAANLPWENFISYFIIAYLLHPFSFCRSTYLLLLLASRKLIQLGMSNLTLLGPTGHQPSSSLNHLCRIFPARDKNQKSTAEFQTPGGVGCSTS